MYELKTVAVEVSDVGGVVAVGEVGAICWFTFVGAAGFDCRCSFDCAGDFGDGVASAPKFHVFKTGLCSQQLYG